MIQFRAILWATVVGIVIQIIMVTTAHFVPWFLHSNMFLFALMMIAATSGYLYAADTGSGYFPGATAGAISGGICGFIGIAVSVLFHDTAQQFIPIDTAICVLTGAVGGIWGQVSANMKRAGW